MEIKIYNLFIFMKLRLSLLVVLILALILRLFGINWDQGFLLHPDERMLMIIADRIYFFNNLNPNFFNYGSFPIYLLKGSAQFIDFIFNLNIANYQGMLYWGRFLSIVFNLLTILLIYKICFFLFSNKKNQKTIIAFFSAFFYTIAFFPIQNSHFFISDVFLTSFTTLLIFTLLRILKLYLDNNRLENRIFYFLFLGFNLALITATKFTGIVFYPLVLFFIFILTFQSSKNNLLNKLKNLLFLILVFNFSFLIFNFLFMPYAFLNFEKFLADILLQSKMNNNPYIFPYTLQYIGTIPYFYYLKNIFLWGIGPFISLFTFAGLILFLKELLNNANKKYQHKNKKAFSVFFNMYVLFFIFYISYFLIIGRSAVKFMRYMLPLYPFLTILAGYGFSKIFKQLKQPQLFFKVLISILIFASIIYSLMFINIYSQKHTRIAATEWILKNIPAGSILAVEHWDDRLPLYGGENYNFLELNLYDQPDDEIKWQGLNEKLNKTDYIIIASNRLYVPLQKLTDCQKHKICYPKTAKYYQKLFKNQLTFKKVAEFSNYPHLKIGNWKLEINDHSADESFTVYDHPKIIIFKKK